MYMVVLGKRLDCTNVRDDVDDGDNVNDYRVAKGVRVYKSLYIDGKAFIQSLWALRQPGEVV